MMRWITALLRQSPRFRSSVRTFIQSPKSEPLKEVVAGGEASEATVPKLSRKERLVNYLNMVKYDYKEALKEVVEFGREKPIRATLYSSLLGLGLYCNKNNPDERSFRENFLLNGHEISLIGDSVRNPGSQNLQDYVSRAYNAGLLRRLNLGVASVMWVDDYSDELGLFAAQCDYLQPRTVDIRHRVIDIGFCGKWWISSKKMEEVDVNTSEWKEDGSPVNSGGQLKQLW